MLENDNMIEDTAWSMNIGESMEVNLDDFYKAVKTRIVAAEKDGWENLSLRFESTYEPYEHDMLGPVLVSLVGLREKTQKEKDEDLVREKISNFALEKDISFHEASTVLRLKEQGKI